MQQQEKTEVKPNAGFKMPEIIYDHESWGKKLLRAVFPKTWWRRVLEGLALAIAIAVLGKIFFSKQVGLSWWITSLIVFYALDCVFAFIGEVVVTVKARRTEKRVVFLLNQIEQGILECDKPIDTSNLDKLRNND